MDWSSDGKVMDVAVVVAEPSSTVAPAVVKRTRTGARMVRVRLPLVVDVPLAVATMVKV
jgi:hypothetical protein